MFDWRGGRRPCYWSQTTWPTTFFRLVSFSCLASSSSWNISPPPDLRLSFLARDFSLSSWARPSSECWWMQVLGRSRWRMAVVLLINTLTLSLSLSRLVSPDFYLDKLTEKVGPFDYILIFLWVSRTERYHNILILVILNINITVISGPRPDLKASPHPQFGPSLENSWDKSPRHAGCWCWWSVKG